MFVDIPDGDRELIRRLLFQAYLINNFNIDSQADLLRIVINTQIPERLGEDIDNLLNRNHLTDNVLQIIEAIQQSVPAIRRHSILRLMVNLRSSRFQRNALFSRIHEFESRFNISNRELQIHNGSLIILLHTDRPAILRNRIRAIIDT
ncbi:MAG: hypothetical protein PHS34_08440 [Candidatus Omnitrophica bacterium]|nr:hypothetical protein [Candidatus Nanoarchaeia archaeon]MDD5551273.1 hypothetical protein [Candidatus Omnitrophota bacterium]